MPGISYWLLRRVFRVRFEGGPGDTAERAILIRRAPNNGLGVLAEYGYLTNTFGRGWVMRSQSLIQLNNRYLDKLDIVLRDGATRTVFFDVTEFLGKRFFGRD
jgi:hypothetical protein